MVKNITGTCSSPNDPQFVGQTDPKVFMTGSSARQKKHLAKKTVVTRPYFDLSGAKINQRDHVISTWVILWVISPRQIFASTSARTAVYRWNICQARRTCFDVLTKWRVATPLAGLNFSYLPSCCRTHPNTAARRCFVVYSKAFRNHGGQRMRPYHIYHVHGRAKDASPSRPDRNPRTTTTTETLNNRGGLFSRLCKHGVTQQVVGAVAQPVVCRHLVQGAQGHRGKGGVRHL